MPPYQLFLHGRVYEFLAGLPRAKRSSLIIFLRTLAADPFRPHDYQEAVHEFYVSVKLFEAHAILYRVDHAAKELKVVEIRPADKS